ncbi:MAG: hypothetical protein LBB86_09295 [Oscillospiraceae bacterium]|jgi:hypothetical protein|nr:hypothetical protein [Oscillospiraceae bacterium]
MPKKQNHQGAQRRLRASDSTCSNGGLLENQCALAKMRNSFSAQLEQSKDMLPTFEALVSIEMKRQKWDGVVFHDKTLLDQSLYSYIVGQKAKEWSLRTVVAICVGLGVNKDMADRLLTAAGFAFGATLRHRAYAFLFTNLQGYPIEDCSAFLVAEGLEPLGSRKQRTK